jgi:hypothetical protein
MTDIEIAGRYDWQCSQCGHPVQKPDVTNTYSYCNTCCDDTIAEHVTHSTLVFYGGSKAHD